MDALQSISGAEANKPSPTPAQALSKDLPAKPRANRSATYVYILSVLLFFAAVVGWQYRELFLFAPSANSRVYICAETGRTFVREVEAGETEPVESPFSGKKTAWIAESCYWSRNGSAKVAPSYVLLNERIGRPGPTICPDCGRIVVGHNPRPAVESTLPHQ